MYLRNFGSVIRLSTPQIYSSTVVFMPAESQFHKYYFNMALPQARVVSTQSVIGMSLRTLEGHREIVSSVAFSPDGKKLASGCSGSTVQLWNAETGISIGAPFEGRDLSVRSVAFSPDGKTLALASYEDMCL